MLLPIGALLIVLGTSGSLVSCYGGEWLNDAQSQTQAAQLKGHTDTPADLAQGNSPQMILAPMAGLCLAVGLVCVGLGMGNWRRPVPSDVRPANPWNDQPGEHGDPPVGQV
jgi:hypothetical protein